MHQTIITNYGDGWAKTEHVHFGASETFVSTVGEIPASAAYQPNMSGAPGNHSTWVKPTRPYAEMDTECYPDYWLAKFRLPDDSMYSFPLHAGSGVPLNYEAIYWIINNYTLLTFNGDAYDIPMLTLALTGATPHQLRQANNNLIVGGLKHWHFYDTYGLQRIPNLDHVDIMEVAPGVRISLKAYMARMHAPTVQDLPYDSDQPTTMEMRNFLDLYCGNDLHGNRMLRLACAERLALRENVGVQYGIDVRSKSDAQMAEAIIKSQLPFKPERRVVPHGYQFQYEPPPYVRFTTPAMQAMFETVKAAWFSVFDVDQLGESDLVGPDGKKIKTGVKMPPELKQLIPLGDSKYQFGIGGLHSTESAVAHHTVMGKWSISDHDVKSYYPSLILALGMFPAQLGPVFLDIYKDVYDKRLAAKAAAQRIKKEMADNVTNDARMAEFIEMSSVADGLKITANGTFGKLFSKYSILFAPELGIRVTITGQLCLLMLIESLHLVGVATVSANTDGIVLRTPVGREWLRTACIKQWESVTGLEMEATTYRAIYSRDVNSYIAFKMDGTFKGKGAFGKSGVVENSHPEKDVCTDAVIEYLRAGVPLEKTIRECKDLRKFIVVRNVKGGGLYDRQYLGKCVRWYYAAGNTKTIRYKDKENKEGLIVEGNTVAGSTGAQPCMTLPAEMPNDVDHDRYIAEAVKMLGTLGVTYAT